MNETAGQVNQCEISGDYLTLNGSLNGTNLSDIAAINAYSLPVFTEEKTADYSALAPIGSANMTISNGLNSPNDDIILGDFEGAQNDGWILGDNTGSILSTIKDMASADGQNPAFAAQGGYFLQVTKSAAVATTKSYVVKNFVTPLDLSTYKYINYDFYGWAGTSTSYFIDMVVTATDNTTQTYTIQCVPGVWMANNIDISGFAKRSSISSIKFAYYGSDLAVYAGNWTGCFGLDGINASNSITNPSGSIDPVAALNIDSFETGTEGFEKLTNTNAIGNGSFAGNSKCLEVTKDGVVPTIASAIKKTYAAGAELNLSSYKMFSLDVANWGGAAEKYAYEITLTSSDNKSLKVKKYGEENTWNTLLIDISGFAGRGNIASVEIAFSCEGNIVPAAAGGWAGHFFIDNIMAYSGVGRLFDFEYGSVNGWTAGDNIYSNYVCSSEGILPYPTIGSHGQNFLMGQKQGSPDTVSSFVKNFSVPLDLSNFSVFAFDFFNHGGGSTTETYQVELILTSGSASKTYSSTVSANTWNKLKYGVDDFAGRNSVTQIKINFKALNPVAVSEWNGSFFVDNMNIGGVLSKENNGTIDASGNISFNIALSSIDDIGKKFVIVLTKANGDKQLVDTAKYVTNPSMLGKNKDAYPVTNSIKGLQVQLSSDAERLSIKHAGFNIALNSLLTLTSHGDSSIPYTYDGKIYYFNKSIIEAYDETFSGFTSNNILTNAILIMYPTNLDDMDSPNKYIVHPDAIHKDGNYIDAINLTNQTGVDYYTAMISFLAQRYNGDNTQYGRINGYIVGNEIGAECWNSMGEKPVDEYIKQYERQLRLTNTIVKQAWSNARVYVSLDYFWEMNGFTYNNKQIINLINQNSKEGGDYDWSVAFHPYPEDLNDARTWNDSSATDSLNSARITFKNLQVLPRYLKQTAYLFNGVSRRIILSEQGFNTRDDSEYQQNLQASAYAYAYYKAASIPEIDAFLLHRHVDNTTEFGLNLGMWTTAAGEVSQPGTQKKIYNVFKNIDTVDSLNVSSFALGIIGADTGTTLTNWNQIIPEFNLANIGAILNRPVMQIGVGGNPVNSSNIEVLSSGTTNNWIANDNTSNIAVLKDSDNSKNVLTASVNGYNFKEYKGLTYTPTAPLDLTSKPKLMVEVKATNIGVGKKAEYMIRVYSGDKVIEGSYTADGNVWNRVGIDLANFSGVSSVDRIKVWARPVEDKSWSSGMISIDNLSVSSTANFIAYKPISFGMYNVSIKNIVTKIEPKTRVSEFISLLTLNSAITIALRNANNVLLNSADVIGTGAKIEVLAGGNLTETYRIVVYGDVDGNGVVSILDLAKMKKHLLKIQYLAGEMLAAGDTSKDGSVSISDVLAVKKDMLNISRISQS